MRSQRPDAGLVSSRSGRLQKRTSCRKKARPKKLSMQRRVIAFLSSLLGLTVSVHDEQLYIRIPCQANVEPGLQYRKISWYKVKEESDGLIGLVIKDLHTHETVLYKFANQSYEVGDDYSLLLPEFSEKDCGHYRCTLWPPLGHYIQDGDQEFYQFGCSKPSLQSKTVTVSTQVATNMTEVN
ncbi:hypothetical protein MHYP_G00325340 [Metynnis hypsauchen]